MIWFIFIYIVIYFGIGLALMVFTADALRIDKVNNSTRWLLIGILFFWPVFAFASIFYPLLRK